MHESCLAGRERPLQRGSQRRAELLDQLRVLGFFQSVDNTIWNSVQADSAIPVKFSLNGNQV
jgi:hypothetical protein